MAKKILIVDDDDDELIAELRIFFDDYDIFEASNIESALQLLSHANEIGVVILDLFYHLIKHSFFIFYSFNFFMIPK